MLRTFKIFFFFSPQLCYLVNFERESPLADHHPCGTNEQDCQFVRDADDTR